MRPDPDGEKVTEWVDNQLAALDNAPTRQNWRYRAVGKSTTQILADVDRVKRIEMVLPLPTWRVIKQAAGQGSVVGYIKAALQAQLTRDGYGQEAGLGR